MAKFLGTFTMIMCGLTSPLTGSAQGLASEMSGLHGVLNQLYNEMMPLCSRLISVGQAIAGFAATWYIASRVWRHIANAEPVDFYPLFRPFVLGFCIVVFPSILGMINGIMRPVVAATAAMVRDSDKAISTLLKRKQEAIKKTNAWQMYMGENGNGDRARWYKYTHDGANPSGEGIVESIGNDIKFAMAKASYSFRNSVKEWMSEILMLLFEAAALCINTLRTFQMIVLSILGPLVFGIAVFDGLQHTLTAWIARYINVFLWLPVANIFGGIIGKIQENMLELDLVQIGQTGDTFFSRTDTAYMVFLIIGIVGYFAVPSVANYIVHAGGGGALTHKVTNLFASSSRAVVNTVSTGVAMTAGGLSSVATSNHQPESMSSTPKQSTYMSERLKGNIKS